MWYFYILLHGRKTTFFMLDLCMATVTANELLMNRIHSEQEMENGLKLFASFALRSILSVLTRHNQHLNEIECFRTHSPAGFIKLCCGVGKRHRKRGTCDYHKCAITYCFQIISVRHFHGAINWMEVHQIWNDVWIYLFIKMGKHSFPHHVLCTFLMNIIWWLSQRKGQGIFHSKIKRIIRFFFFLI